MSPGFFARPATGAQQQGAAQHEVALRPETSSTSFSNPLISSGYYQIVTKVIVTGNADTTQKARLLCLVASLFLWLMPSPESEIEKARRLGGAEPFTRLVTSWDRIPAYDDGWVVIACLELRSVLKVPDDEQAKPGKEGVPPGLSADQALRGPCSVCVGAAGKEREAA